MPGKDSDRLQREIEDILDKLDTFVPEERLATKIKNRRRQDKAIDRARSGPSAWERLQQRLSRVTLGQVLIAGLILLAISFFFAGPLGAAARWVTIAGLVLAAGAFAISLFSGRGTRSTLTGRVQKRWRGQIIEYGEPSPMERVRGWFRRKGRR